MRPRAVVLLLLAAVGVLAVLVLASSGDGGGSQKRSKSAGVSAGGSTEEKPRPRKVHGAHDAPVPILMYHVITDPPRAVPFPELYVSASNFKSQINALAKAGHHGVTLGRVHDYWTKGYALPDKPIVVSFDDGYESQYKNALPVLKSHDWPGVLNLVTKNLDESWGLQPKQVKGLISAGWEVDAHTIHHLDVSTLTGAALDHEVGGSRKLIQRKFKVPVDFFCYPSGRFDDTAISAVKRAGFKGATTTEPGPARPSQPYTLARVRVNRTDTAQGLVKQLESLGN